MIDPPTTPGSKDIDRVCLVSFFAAVLNGIVPPSLEYRRIHHARQTSPCRGFPAKVGGVERGGVDAGGNGGPPGLKYVGRLLDDAGIDAVEVSCFFV